MLDGLRTKSVGFIAKNEENLSESQEPAELVQSESDESTVLYEVLGEHIVSGHSRCDKRI